MEKESGQGCMDKMDLLFKIERLPFLNQLQGGDPMVFPLFTQFFLNPS
jgi:hypothetical protein